MTLIRAAVLSLIVVAATAGAAEARPLTQRDLVGLDRVSDPHISPDGRLIAYDLGSTDIAANKRGHSIWIVGADGRAPPRKLADGANPRWAPDGGRLYYLSDAKGVTQVFAIRPTPTSGGGKPEQVTALPLDVDSFRLAPDGRSLVVSVAVFPAAEESPAATLARQEARKKDKSSGRLYDRLFVRHWDTWANGTRNHLFALKIGPAGKAEGTPVALMPGFDGDAPSKPFGGDEDYNITPDSKTVVFSARLAGVNEPWSTNFDLYSAPLDGSKPPHDFTGDNKAWDTGAVFSPDGKLAAHRAMKRAGFEADRFGVILYEDATQKSHEIDPAWDRSPDSMAFAGDSRSLYMTADDIGTTRLFQMAVADGAVHPLTTGGHVSSFDVAHTPSGDVITYLADSMAGPAQVFVLKPGGAPRQVTHADGEQLAGVQPSPYEQFSFTGWNGDKVYGYVVKPAGWRPGGKYPTAFLIHGGPQGSWTDSWSYRWNPQVWAGWGYAVVMVDFHGSTGYGQGFTDAISGHWGDRPLEDLQKGWAAAQAKYPWIDGRRACAAGASYGGFMTYWIAGVWNQPWKCLIDHDGVFDNRMMGYETEELWFSEWENGHTTVWENPENYEKFNPINHVKDWSKPILVVHSEKDFRIPIDQGIAAFTAAQRKGIDSEFLTFPDENHWVLKPANSLQWNDTVQAWMKRWVGDQPSN